MVVLQITLRLALRLQGLYLAQQRHLPLHLSLRSQVQALRQSHPRQIRSLPEVARCLLQQRQQQVVLRWAMRSIRMRRNRALLSTFTEHKRRQAMHTSSPLQAPLLLGDMATPCLLPRQAHMALVATRTPLHEFRPLTRHRDLANQTSANMRPELLGSQQVPTRFTTTITATISIPLRRPEVTMGIMATTLRQDMGSQVPVATSMVTITRTITVKQRCAAETKVPYLS